MRTSRGIKASVSRGRTQPIIEDPVPDPYVPIDMTEDNGTAAFAVQLITNDKSEQLVHVWRAGYDEREDIDFAAAYVLTLSHVLQVWVGSGEDDDIAHDYIGNSFLVHTSTDVTGLCHYTYIGIMIYTFTTPTPIHSFIGTVCGGSQIVWSFAQTEHSILSLATAKQYPRPADLPFTVAKLNDYYMRSLGRKETDLDNYVVVAPRII